MPGYFMGMVHGIKDGEAFGAYQGVAEPTIEQYGGKMVWLSSKVESGDGDFEPMAIVMFEFKPAAEIRRILTEHGITPDKNVYTY